MKLIESKVEYLPQDKGLEGVYRQIEKCGRVSYKSEDKITEDSAEPFVKRLIDSHHYAVLEHGTVYLKISKGNIINTGCLYHYNENPYSKVVLDDNYNAFITTNYRVISENNWFSEMYFYCSPTEYHERRYTFKFTCSRAIANELIRHRVFSFCQESTRFCNYSKGKFNGKVSFIVPSWCNFTSAQIKEYEEGNFKHSKVKEFALLNGLREAEEAYIAMLLDDCTPQQARDVLPNATKTELIMTGFASDWARLFELRLHESTGKVAPDMKVLMQKAWKEFENYEITRDLERYIKL